MEIEIWSDFACPWCALGLLRLDAALGRFEHGDAVGVVHRSFELHPGAPARREQTLEQAVAAKYGMSADHVRAGHARLTELGREVGFAFDFERVRLGSTFDAHRLAQAARGTEGEARLLQGLFAAHFSEGRQLSDPAVLGAVGRAAGLDERLIDAVLGGDAYADAVRADEARAEELEVMGVPHFLINGAWAIPGAQDVETFLTVLNRAWARSAH
jgi:predicted DsbA family dithiol-disulfide isomerase